MNKLLDVYFGEGKYEDLIKEATNWILEANDVVVNAMVVMKVKGGKYKINISFRYK